MQKYDIRKIYKGFYSCNAKDKRAFYLAMQEEISALRGVIDEMKSAKSLKDVGEIAQKAASIVHHDIEAEYKAFRVATAKKCHEEYLARERAAAAEAHAAKVRAAKAELVKIHAEKARIENLRRIAADAEPLQE